MKNKNEDDMIRSLEKLRVYEELAPAILELVKAGGSAEAVLAKSESLAAATLFQSLQDDNPKVRLEAAKEVLNRTQGKPVERNISIYGDLNKMADQDLDRQIELLMGQIAPKQLEAPKQQKARRPRKNEIIEAEVLNVVEVATKSDTPTKD